jgi:hypothetical protein
VKEKQKRDGKILSSARLLLTGKDPFWSHGKREKRRRKRAVADAVADAVTVGL